MSRILLADDSPHAQRMGERILRDEGYEVVSVTDGETALLRMADVDPDLILADVFLPGRSGLDLCSYVKSEPKHSHVRIVLTAGMLEAFDEEQALLAGADAIIKKPFEASAVIATLKPLLEAAREAKGSPAVERPVLVAEPSAPPPGPVPVPIPVPPPGPVAVPAPERPVQSISTGRTPMPPPGRIVEMPPPSAPEPEFEPEPESELLPSGTGISEEELLRAAVTLALDAAFPALVDDITAKVLRNLRAAGSEPPARDREPASGIPVPVAPISNDPS